MAAILSRGFPDPACSSSGGIWLMHSSNAGWWFSLLARMTCAAGHVEENDLLLPSGQGAHEATLLRQEFEHFHVKQITERPMMAAPLFPPGRLLHLRRLPVGRNPPKTLASAYEARWITADELMSQGLLVSSTFFTDHFPDKVVAVLSELAVKYSAGSNKMSRHYSFSSCAIRGKWWCQRWRNGR